MPNGCSGNFWQDYNFRLASNPKRGIRRRACDGKCCQCPEKPDCKEVACPEDVCKDGRGRREINGECCRPIHSFKDVITKYFDINHDKIISYSNDSVTKYNKMVKTSILKPISIKK